MPDMLLRQYEYNHYPGQHYKLIYHALKMIDMTINMFDLHTFKTKQCPLNHRSPTHAPYDSHCPYYHSNDDRRRIPLQPHGHLNYTSDYLEDTINQPTICNNLIQYLYHPHVYKTIKCNELMCLDKYCPKLHEGEVREQGDKGREGVGKVGNKDRQLAKMKGVLDKLVRLKEIGTKGIVVLEEMQNEDIKGQLQKIKQRLLNKLDNPNPNSNLSSKFKLGTPNPNPNPKLKFKAKTISPQPQSSSTLSPSLPPPLSNHPPIPPLQYFNQFYANQQLSLIQDRHHQFKNYRDLTSQDTITMLMQYITAFLNSQGGILYIGIDNTSIVNGFKILQQDYDKFLLTIDRQAKYNMYPPLLPQKYSIRRIPVQNNMRKQLWVVQVRVFGQYHPNVLTVYNRHCFMRMDASKHKLDAVDILEYVRINLNKENIPKQLLQRFVQAVLLTSQEEQLLLVKEMATWMKSLETVIETRKQLGQQ